jgi:hypothetical protein
MFGRMMPGPRRAVPPNGDARVISARRVDRPGRARTGGCARRRVGISGAAPAAGINIYRVSKSFLRLRKLLKGLVSLPGEPFRKHRGAFVPVFQIGVNRGMLSENRRGA